MDTNADLTAPVLKNEKTAIPFWIYLLLFVVLGVGAYFRFIGLNWDEGLHLHPDERFLTMVETSISPVNSLSEYFNTEKSSLNPHNVGYPTFVYGTLPIFLVRYLAQAVQMEGYDKVFLLGRMFSATLDVLNIMLVFFISFRLYRKPWLSLLASALMAFAVLPIQLSHYFTVDSYLSFFCTLTFGSAVLVATANNRQQIVQQSGINPLRLALQTPDPTLVGFLLFAVTYGMALASKINALPMVILLFIAASIFYSRTADDAKPVVSIHLIRNIILAGVFTFIVFRVLQPYAFEGPSFFNIMPNEKWLGNLKELTGLSSGEIDYPPSLQWARRPSTFALSNMVTWGMGLPFGIIAWVGFLFMGWRILRGDWKSHSLIWFWTGAYYVWQASGFNPSMRYLIPIYPMMAIIAAWFVASLGDVQAGFKIHQRAGWKTGGIVLGLLVAITTMLWAFAFTRIYDRPMTRVAASRWVYRNIPSAINLPIKTGEKIINQPFNNRKGFTITQAAPLRVAFKVDEGTVLNGILLNEVKRSIIGQDVLTLDQTHYLNVLISEDIEGTLPIFNVQIGDGIDQQGISITVPIPQPLSLEPGKQYYLILRPVHEAVQFSLSGTLKLVKLTTAGNEYQPLIDIGQLIKKDQDAILQVRFQHEGTVDEIVLYQAIDYEGFPGEKTLQARLFSADGITEVNQGKLQSDFSATAPNQGKEYRIPLEKPMEVKAGEIYQLWLGLVDGEGAIGLKNPKLSEETSWDDAVPQNLDGYIAYDPYFGLYPRDLNFQLYWDDNSEKLQRMTTILDEADYIVITSNRQYASTVRVPERYPLTKAFYKYLMGCPDAMNQIACYNDAKPGMFNGQLGFRLIEAFQSNPNLGSLEFNSQYAEEAFTVYDAPKVMIFEKSDDYDPSAVRSLLGAVDLTNVQALTPSQASKTRGSILLPTEKMIEISNQGTWSELFPSNSLLNRFPGLAAIAWYGSLLLLGWAFYPFTRLALAGLKDKGYIFSRLIGLLLVAWLTWFSGSNGVPVVRATIALALVIFLLLTFWLWRRESDVIEQEIRQNRRIIAVSELVFLVLFIISLGIRAGNPDLWHPYFGGEKPMDMAYFTAVLKSVSFPPYNPWFEGGYINYYYYGFVLYGVWVKLLGIIPSVAYNLVLPTIFAMAGAGAFSVGFNLVSSASAVKMARDPDEPISPSAWLGGAGAAIGLVFLGNLGSLRMIVRGIMRLAPNAALEGSAFWQRIIWFFQGIGKVFEGASLPYGLGSWYWDPSRVYQQNVITEFPLFTLIYADLHAHMMALPITVLIIAISLGWINWFKAAKADQNASYIPLIAGFLLAGLSIGTLKPTHTWDMPTYLVFMCVVIVFVMACYGKFGSLKNSSWLSRLVIAGGACLGLYVLSKALYSPYDQWFVSGYNKINLWEGERSDLPSYLTHWGLFLFMIVVWYLNNSLDWMRTTPARSLLTLRKFRWLIWLMLFALIAAIVGLNLLKVSVATVVLPLLAWSLLLLLRPNQSDTKKMTIFMIGTGLLLTLAAELIVLEGDIGRMNWVFRLYYQAWTLLAISSAAAFAWLLPMIDQSSSRIWKGVFRVANAFLILSAALFLFLGGSAKIRDRMNPDTPFTLDGMQYMNGATYQYDESRLELSEDYRAIKWMQESIAGTPTIMEAANCDREYRWCARYSIYTGLPNVVGWSWHQRQQQMSFGYDAVSPRIAEVQRFYSNMAQQEVEKVLEKYRIEYIVVGRLERLLYPANGLQRLNQWNGKLWDVVYQDGETSIYRVKANHD